MKRKANGKQARKERSRISMQFNIRSSRAMITRALFMFFALGLSASPVFADGASSVTNIFKPDGPPARAIFDYTMLVLAVCAVIFVIVVGLLVYTVTRFRHRREDDGQEPPQVYGSNQIELAWTVIPIIIVFVLTLVTARTIAEVQNAVPPPKALKVTVVGHQWWWEIRYPDLGVVTANELHVPVSDPAQPRPTFLKLESADVAHSFWIPQLAGKTDVIPNRDNSMWIEPVTPGTYLGNCAEYCGTQHARMLIRVIVHPQGEFENWVAAQKPDSATDTNLVAAQKPDSATDTQVKAGRDVFFSTSCVNCHTINGTEANGKFGPDLTHLMSRQTLGSGAALNTPEKLRAWVRNPQNLKPGCYMPDMQLTDEEMDQLVRYLLTLN
ncbi:MAG TPA: cytochrome c oxidase subunit II [Blastocatellia bacterium]|nr:cytochrome c oxidase subunit II [Blastocatellia bacterium]